MPRGGGGGSTGEAQILFGFIAAAAVIAATIFVIGWVFHRWRLAWQEMKRKEDEKLKRYIEGKSRWYETLDRWLTNVVVVFGGVVIVLLIVHEILSD
jgi:hypothetical protein